MVTYPSGLSDIAVLKNYSPIPVQSFERQEDVDTCIYDGYLSNENDVYVTLTGCAHTNTFNASTFKKVDRKIVVWNAIFFVSGSI